MHSTKPYTLTGEDNALLFVEKVNNEANWELLTLSGNAYKL